MAQKVDGEKNSLRFSTSLIYSHENFYEEFGKAFLLADILIVTDVYPAREEPIQGITGELIVNAAKEFGHKNANYLKDKKMFQIFKYNL